MPKPTSSPNLGRSHRREPAPITDWVRKFDNESVRELMLHYRPLLYEIATSHWNRGFQARIDPSDALQLTWTSMTQSVERTSFENRHHFAGFLMKTLNHHLVSLHRSLYAKKRSVAREVPLSEESSGTALATAMDEPNALDRLIDQELARETLHAILRLPRELQRLLRWRFRKGMTYSEIAVMIGRSEHDVRHLIDKCVKAICRDLRTRPIGRGSELSHL